MTNQFSSKNTFKFVNALYKKANAKAYRDMLEQHQVGSKYEFVHRAVDDTLPSTRYWMAGHADKSSRVKRANELWKCGIECHTHRYFSSNEIKLSSFKRLNEKSGLLALLKEMYIYNRNFDWAEIVKGVDFNKVISAYTEWCQYHARDKKVRFKTLNSYAANYYNSYRAWLHKIGAIKQTGRKGLWKLTQFGHDMAEELMKWHDKKNLK